MPGWLQCRWTPLGLLLCALASLALFLYGFFPLKYHTGRVAAWDDLPVWIEEVSIDGQEVYNPGPTSAVLMVIDALRYDFVTEEYMPFTAQLLKNKSACIYVALADPPTVTMPRIKSPERKREKAQWRRTINFWRDIFAMMTGSVSTFADVAFNFGAPAVRGDSVVRAAAARGRRLVMYGDDTWLRLFPGLWAEADGTTSFYVSDYTEVDNNVTRHLDRILAADEKKQPPFDLLVLHYLGLDHIGHLEGARSDKVKPKLLEMDGVVKKIFTAMESWERSGALVVCGDHGMRDAGGHGGASPAELRVPLVLARTHGFQCPHAAEGPGGTVAQTDVAPSLAYLLRAPLPGDSTGRILPALLPPLAADTRQHLYLLHYNALQNARALADTLGADNAQEKECYKQFRRAEGQFASYLARGEQSAARLAKQFYEESLQQMSKYLTESTVDFDMFAILLAVLLLFLMLIALVVVTAHSLEREPQREACGLHRRRSAAGALAAFLFVALCCGGALVLACAISETGSSLCKLRLEWSCACAAAALAAAAAFFLIKSGLEQAVEAEVFRHMNNIDCMLIAGTVLHSLSFVGTSFIEEEHLTWYFLWNSLMLLTLVRTLAVLVEYVSQRLDGATAVQEKPALRARMAHVGADMLPKWLLLIGLHRFLRTMNQTGDRWAFLPDTADWLNQPSNAGYLQALLVTGMALTLLACLWNLRFTNNTFQMNTALTLVSCACVVAYRIATHALPAPSPLAAVAAWDTVHICNVFWGLLFANILFETFTFLGVYRGSREKVQDTCRHTDKKNSLFLSSNDNAFLYQKPKEKIEDFETEANDENEMDGVKLSLARSLSHIILNNLMLMETLLMRPHNVILVPSVYVTCLLTARCTRHGLLRQTAGAAARAHRTLDQLAQALAHFWIGCVFFFYQGNSNSLASVELSAGYVGLREYCPVRVSLRLGAHTYAGPALAGMALFCTLAAGSGTWRQYKLGVWRCACVLALVRVYSLAVYAGVAAGFRHHLFVWTVFSPKLLYDFVATVFSATALATVAAIFATVALTHACARRLASPARLWQHV